MDYRSGIILRGYDAIGVVKHVHRLSKRFQATLLSQMEELITDDGQYSIIRKLILDAFNNYTREIVTSIFGDIDVE